MPVTIGSNIASLRTQRLLARASDGLASAYERLSSGQRINRAADDAAGLAIASSLSAQSRVFIQAIKNVNDGVSLLNVTSGALDQLGRIVTRQKELAEQAANGVYSYAQRAALDDEARALTQEYNRIVQSTRFNNLSVFSTDTLNLTLQHGFGAENSTLVDIGEALGPRAGEGTLGDASYIGFGSNAFHITLSELNGDGNLDLVVGIQGSVYSFATLLGRGDGTFAYQGNFAGLPSTDAPRLADLNGDGFLDVVQSSDEASLLTVSLGNGDGSFKAPTYHANLISNVFNSNVSLGDVNGDGRPDIVVSDDSASGALLLNLGNGTFAAATTLAGAGFLADFNNDGKLDLVTSAGTIGVSLGNGDGTFSSPLFSNGGGTMMYSSEGGVADLNNDGNLDILRYDFPSHAMYAYLGNGDGTFEYRGFVGHLDNGGTNGGIALADMNGDGIVDMVNGSYAGNPVGTGIYLGNGDGSFRAGVSVGAVPGAGFVLSSTVGDINNDGIPDWVYGTSTNGVLAALGNPDPSGRRNYLQQFFDLGSVEGARAALEDSSRNLDRIIAEQGRIGAVQSRLQTVIDNLTAANIDTKRAESRIVDADIAHEASELARLQILQQAGAAVLAQANLNPRLALTLLQP